MVAVRLDQFIGEQPRIVARRLPDNAAQSARNTRLDDGALTPIRKATTAYAPGHSNWRTHETLHRHGSTWFAWSGVVHAAPGPVADDRLYYTGDGVPKVQIGGLIYNLAVSRPTSALNAAASGVGSGDVTTRVYVYTHVTGAGEESEPNSASAAVDWQPGQSVTLSGFSAVPAGRNITKQRIYRSQTGQSGTYFYLIAERNASANDYVDSIEPDAFQEALPSADWNTPRDTLSGLAAMDNGMMAAFVGRELYFCEPYHPHAWPEKYALKTDYEIVAVRAVGPVLVVMTKGTPYLITGSHPATLQMTQLEYNAPCINERAVVGLGYAVAYPTQEGLMTIDATGRPQLVTAKLFRREDWAAYSPETMHAAQLSGRYVAFYDTVDVDNNAIFGALMIDTTGEAYLIQNATRAASSYFDITSSCLFYIDPSTGKVMEFDSLDAPREHLHWKSKKFTFPLPVNFAAIVIDGDDTLSAQELANITDRNDEIRADNEAKIAAGPIHGAFGSRALNASIVNGSDLTPLVADQTDTITATIYADDVAVETVTETNAMVRLPADRSARDWEIDVYGNLQVLRIAMASTVDELRTTP